MTKTNEHPVFLIGMRASGKTSVGRALARRLDYAFVDLDVLLREQLGKEVAEIVAQEGWDGFRTHEARILRQACAPRTVIATGGGAVLRADNRDFILQSGRSVYLKAAPETLIKRLQLDPNPAQRPRLAAQAESGASDDPYHPGEEIRETLRQRADLYHEAAHTVVDAEQPIAALVEAIAVLLRETGGGEEERS